MEASNAMLVIALGLHSGGMKQACHSAQDIACATPASSELTGLPRRERQGKLSCPRLPN